MDSKSQTHDPFQKGIHRWLWISGKTAIKRNV